ncbi:MAG: hypothetical protein COA57_05865 [Flavobacteriales bacterium]|nr:MAG: hypothetical protein COA57_05865 [Flavobacteriales bacterium]
MEIKPLVFLAMCLVIGFAFGQETNEYGKIEFKIYPMSAIIKLDGKLLESRDTTIILKTGKHHFILWAPDRELFQTDVEIYKDSTIKILHELKYTEDYLQYEIDLIAYKKLRKKKVTLPFLGLAFLGGSSVPFFKWADQYHAKALSSITMYEQAVNEQNINSYKEKHERYRNKYRLNQSIGIGLVTLTTLCTGFYIKSLISYYKSKSPRPTYKNVPFTKNTNFSISTDFVGNYSCNLFIHF